MPAILLFFLATSLYAKETKEATNFSVASCQEQALITKSSALSIHDKLFALEKKSLDENKKLTTEEKELSFGERILTSHKKRVASQPHLKELLEKRREKHLSILKDYEGQVTECLLLSDLFIPIQKVIKE